MAVRRDTAVRGPLKSCPLVWLLLLGLMALLAEGSVPVSGSPWELVEPVAVWPSYDHQREAYVTEVTLRVQLRNLTVSLQRGKGSFQYTGRVYQLVNKSALAEPSKDPAEAAALHTLVPGPTLRVRPGGFIRMKLINDLEESHTDVEGNPNSTAEGRMDGSGSHAAAADKEKENSSPFPFDPMFYTMHHPNITNVHFHGLHCDPHIDDPFVAVVPKGSATGRSEHEYWLPITADHIPGLHWYHAHSHGSVYFQVMGGLFGGLIVEETPLEEPRPGKSVAAVPRPSRKRTTRPHETSGDAGTEGGGVSRPWLSSAVPSRLLVFHLYRLGPGAGEEHCDGQSMAALDTMVGNSVVPSSARVSFRKGNREEGTVTENIFLVNGQHLPVVSIQANTPTLLRMLYAAGSCSLNLTWAATTSSGASACTMIPAATDGVPLDVAHLSRDHNRKPLHANATSWLYFTTATRHEVLLLCTANGVDSYTFPVVNQAGRTLMEIRVVSSNPSTLLPPKTLSKSEPFPGGNHDLLVRQFHQLLEPRERLNVSEIEPHPLAKTPRTPRLPAYLDTGNRTMPSSSSSTLERDSLHLFRWELSFSQAAVLQSSTVRESHVRPFYVLGEGSDCHTSSISPLLENTSFLPSSTCYYHPFEGARGEHNTSRYHGFVVPYNDVVEAHIYGDPTDTMPHPLHFHVNHFQFLSFTPRPGGLHTQYTDLSAFGILPGQWRDTIPIFDGETVVRWRAATFSGEILYHCHMLSHEDRGMMASYFIAPAPHRSPSSFELHAWGRLVGIGSLGLLAVLLWRCGVRRDGGMPRRPRDTAVTHKSYGGTSHREP